MPKTTPTQRVLLTFLGFFVSLILIEGGLRIAGFVYTLLQEKENITDSGPSEDKIRILCIGDSMTALGRRNSYPAQLEDILNAGDSSNKYVVLNKGIVGQNSEHLLQILDKLLDKYEPQIVICMIGINDKANEYSPLMVKLERFLNNFRTFDLLTWIWHGIQVKINHNNTATAPDIKDFESEGDDFGDEQLVKTMFVEMRMQIEHLMDSSKGKSGDEKERIQISIEQIKRHQLETLLGVAIYHRARREYAKTIGYLQSAIELEPDNYMAYVELGRTLEEMGQYEKAIPILHRASKIGPVVFQTYFELAKCYEKLGQKEQAERFYESASEIARITKKENISADMGEWFVRNKDFENAKEAMLQAMADRPQDYHLYEQMAALYQMAGNKDEELAKKYFDRAYKLRQEAERFMPETVHNLNKIAEIVVGKGIRLIVMQYPLRRLKPLKDIFWHPDQMAFVDNEASFVKALADEEFKEYFNDFFAGDFGHCTGKGNRIIAENVLPIIRQIVSEK